jgi:two-component system sensor histidine kinase VicK
MWQQQQLALWDTRDPYEILDIGYKLIKAAKDEILIIFHTANAFLRQHKAGGIDLLVANAVKYKTRVKILVPVKAYYYAP